MNAQQSKLRLARLRIMDEDYTDWLKAGLALATKLSGKYPSALNSSEKMILTLAEELEHTRELFQQYLESKPDY